MEETPSPWQSQEPTAPEPAQPETPVTSEKKPELTADQKKAKRKETLKRLALVSGMTYLLVLALILLWAIFFAEQNLDFFRVLPISQAGLGRFLFQLMNFMIGTVVVASLIAATFWMFRSLMAKKEDVAKKKKATRMSIFTGIGFFVLGILWLVAVIILGPKLVPEERFTSPIITDPSVTVGLTAPIDISFDARAIPIDTNTYQVLSYAWNFGDGDNATGPAVTHRYTQKGAGDGRYTVTLDVTYQDLRNGDQFSGSFLTEVGIENDLVAATFTAKPSSGELPLTVSFDASASNDPDGEIVAYEWDLDGDGRFDDAEGVTFEHEFTQEGSFEVTLRVTDNNGEFNTTAQMIEAGSVGGLRAVIDAPLPEGDYYQIDEKYEFNGSLSQINEGNITKYTWDFGDGTTVGSRTANHTFTSSGTFAVTLTVQDSEGNTDEGTMDIQVLDEGTPPSARITTEPVSTSGTVTGGAPFNVTFDAKTSTDPEDDIVEYEWDFDGDGIVDETGDFVSHTYEEVGTFAATLIALDSAGNQDETSVTIEVESQGLVPKLDIDVTNGEIPLTVEFDAAGSIYKEGSIVSYEYDFGDGTDLHIGGSTVTYRYNSVGTFTASVTVVASDGTRGSVDTQIVVRPVALTSCFTVNTDSGKAPLFMSVDPSCTQGTVSTYEWDFGDGEISFDRKPSVHTYTAPGEYTIQLEVTSDDGIVDSFEKDITVN